MAVTTRIVQSLFLSCAVFLSAPLMANPYDISLRGLGRPVLNTDRSDPAVMRFRRLSTELMFAVAPRPLAPAETLGVSGFEIAVASVLSDINENADYWQGQPGNPIFEGVLAAHGGREVPGRLWLPTVHLRKGLPLSTEIGIQGGYIAWSEMTSLGIEGKVALHEAYVRWLPALSVRGAVGRLFGAPDLDILTIEGDVMTSLPIGIGGLVQLTPYLGYGLLAAHVNSQVLDETPTLVTDENDQVGGASGSLYSFDTIDWRHNQHGRLFFGLRLNVAMLEVLYEADFGFLRNKVGTLQSHSIKLGFDV